MLNQVVVETKGNRILYRGNLENGPTGYQVVNKATGFKSEFVATEAEARIILDRKHLKGAAKGKRGPRKPKAVNLAPDNGLEAIPSSEVVG